MHRFPVFYVILAGVVITYRTFVLYTLVIVAVLVMLRLSLGLYRTMRNVVVNRRLTHVDDMDGIEFETYIAGILKNCGYTNIELTEKYDYGVDIIAVKDGIRWGIQVKRYSGLVKADAVRQVVTGLRLYSCDRAMVITNSVFSRVAVRLADSNECVLIDRGRLAKMETDLTQKT
jgi:HJR/Mrr/RecB family endonuclease